jgi:glycosyltransferase involved in cell wall biosynthesis
MRVLCVDQFSNWGGGQRSLLDLLPAFAARGWQPHILLPDEGPLEAELRKLNYPVTVLRSPKYTSIRKPPAEMWRYAVDLPRVARSIEILAGDMDATILYVNGPRLLPPAAWVARRKKIPLVFHCHHFLQQSSSALLSGTSLKMSEAYTIASCRYAADPIKKYVRPERLFVRYNGVVGPDRPLARAAKSLKRIGVIGRIEPEKGQLEFVHAIRLITKSFPECRFVVVGSPMFSSDSYYRSVVAASKGLPIEFVGWQDDVSRLFLDLDLVVVPSCPMEATTRVILEAFAFGVPVIAFPSGGIPEILNDSETGFLAHGVTPAALAERMSAVLRMPPRDLERVTANARKSWHLRFTVENYREEVCAIVEQAAAASRPWEGRRPQDAQTASMH